MAMCSNWLYRKVGGVNVTSGIGLKTGVEALKLLPWSIVIVWLVDFITGCVDGTRGGQRFSDEMNKIQNLFTNKLGKPCCPNGRLHIIGTRVLASLYPAAGSIFTHTHWLPQRAAQCGKIQNIIILLSNNKQHSVID